MAITTPVDVKKLRMASVMRTAATGDEGEASFWAKMIEQLSGQGGAATQRYNTMMAGTAIPCSFALDPSLRDDQLYSLGNSVPQWSLTWNGSYTGSYFGTYLNWLSQIHPKPILPDRVKDLQAIEQQIEAFKDDLNGIRKDKYVEFVTDNCLVAPGSDMSCSAWLPGTSATQFGSVWAAYQATPEYKLKIDNLTRDYGHDLTGLQAQYDALAQQVYGVDFQQITDAYQAAQCADPKNLANTKTGDDLLKYQMMVREGGTADAPILEAVPRYGMQGYTPEQFTKWLADARAGKGTPVTMQLVASDHSTDTSQYSFSGGGGFPVADIFMVGGNVSGGGSSVDIKKYDFNMLVTYASVIYIPIGPADSWFEPSLISDYRNFSDWQDGSPFKGQPLWGPNGLFNLRVTGVYVAYQPNIKFTVANWESFSSETHWHEDASISLFGLISLGSESSGGSTSTTKVTSMSNGFQMQDTSDQPKIIAITVQAQNYTA